ncbi:MAG TPA: ArsR family transcriptional regulator [Bryobacteraceae bacterium]|nr:ArsR family transcriptional regulator [Bryobacteraceae bacterium]
MRAAKQPSRDQIQLGEVLYALSDPVRIEIVLSIAGAGEQPCNQCGIEMPKSSLSHHFKVLRESGIVSTRIEGTRHINSVRTADLNARFPGLLSAILKAAQTPNHD